MTTKLSEQRDAMVKELKELRDTTVLEWEDALRQVQEMTANYLDDVQKIEKELKARADDLHKQVDATLSKNQQTLQQMTATWLAKLQDQEKYLTDRLQRMKDDVQLYEDQLIHADPNVFLQFNPGNIHKEEKPPLSNTCTEKPKIPLFTKGQNDTKSLSEMLGQISNQDVSEMKAAAPSVAPPSGIIPAKPLQQPGNPEAKSKAESRTPTRLLIPNSSVVLSFDISYVYPYIACDTYGLAWIRTGATTIKLMDRQGSVQTTINTKCWFNDMSLTSNGDIILTDYNNNSIKSVSRDGKIRHMFSTEWEPCGLCCLDNGDIVVTNYDDGRVIRYSSTGEIRQTYDSITFRRPYRVAGSKVNQDIYIVDRGTNRVLAIGGDGRLRYEYSGHGKGRFDPWDVCTDQMGHILIADCNNDRVDILKQAGHFIQYIQTSDRSWYIDVDREGYVWVKHSKKINVYKYLQ